MQSWETRRSFPELVKWDPTISGLLGREKLDEIFDPKFYLRNEDAIFARVFADGVGDC